MVFRWVDLQTVKGRLMKSTHERAAVADAKKVFTLKSFSRRQLLAGSAAVGATVALRGEPAAAADGKKTFTILHTNDLHSNLIGMAPASDYSPFTLNEDATRGGFARLATLIAKQKETRSSGGLLGTLTIRR
jgi:5'-nucleotidase